MAGSKPQHPKAGDAAANPGDEAAPGTPGTGENICPACNGTGAASGRRCRNCNGTGRIIEAIGGG